ncbi:peroxisomal membrane anchor protein conserved region-domain-containing protein [Gilbertella persicaria]
MREDLIQSAESFLLHTETRTANKKKKIAFLKSKGLNDDEIQEAFRRVDPAVVPQMEDEPKLPPRLYRQTVYYPLEPIPRLTTIQLMKAALLIGLSVFSVLTAVTLITKRIMSIILNKVAQYQSHRYQQHRHLLSRIELTLKQYSTTDIKTLDLQQSKLNQSIIDMTNTLMSLKKQQMPYQCLNSCLAQFQNMLLQHPSNTPNYQNRLSFGNYGGFATSFADKHHAESDNNTMIQNIKSHIRSLKGTLLSRKNFPAAKYSSIPPGSTVIDPRENHPRKKASFRSELNK